MIINKITLNNFKLFTKEEVLPKAINLFRGENLDNCSSNASGKTTLALDSILFCLYGKANVTLQELVTKGKSGLSVSVELTTNNKEISICRSYPSKLEVIENGNTLEFVTATKTQEYIDSLFGSYEDFRKFRTLDTNKGINILDLGNTTLKNTLMSFIQGDCNSIRESLQEKKRTREVYNIDKRMYSYYPSEKRKEVLISNGLKLHSSIEEINIKIRLENQKIMELESENSSILREKSRLQKEKDALIKQTKQCPVCLQALSIEEAERLINERNERISILSNELNENNSQIKEYEDYVKSLLNEGNSYMKKYMDINSLLERLKLSEKMKEFKYTKKDVYIYQEAIKKVDEFYLYYINSWLKGLEFIINNMLGKLNMQVEFVNDKSFLKIIEGDKELSYGQLSSGQNKFLNIIFKLSILIYKGMSGLVIIDEGIDSLDKTNINKLITLFNTLPFQIFLISQHDGIETGVNVITVKRQGNLSKVAI